MRKITPFDRIEEIFMDADPLTFSQLEERIATIKRLRRLDRKPRAPKNDGHHAQSLLEDAPK